MGHFLVLKEELRKQLLENGEEIFEDFVLFVSRTRCFGSGPSTACQGRGR